MVQKIEIVNLSWNLVLRLIRICRIQGWCSLFLFLTRSTCCWIKFGPEIKSKIWYLDYFEYEEFSDDVHFLYFHLEVIIYYFYLGKLFQKIKIVCWSWHLEPRLILTCRIQWWFSFFFFVLDLFSNFFRKTPFGILVLPD